MKRPSRCVTEARVPRSFAALTAVIGPIKNKAGRTGCVFPQSALLTAAHAPQAATRPPRRRAG